MSNEGYRLSRAISIKELVTADYLTGPHPNTSLHSHEDAWELCCCLEGEMTLYKNGKKRSLKKGNIALVQPEISHGILVRQKSAVVFVISFTCSGEQLRSVQDSVMTFTDDQLRLFYKIIHEIDRGFAQGGKRLRLMSFSPSENSPFGAEQMICNYLEQIIITMLRNVTMRDGEIIRAAHFKDAMQDYLIEQVRGYIADHLHQKLTVELIAERFHYSRARLSTIFKQATGSSINEFITAERMRRAKFLLQEGELAMAEISDLLGYPSPQYFANKFRKEVGCPPSRYVQSIEKD
ncbi:MAG: AraC family transcriptional regulator [Oscillospiraceae bacterium]|nr:AraC family transcriptional regulator [Oscillospiraceae bacterium]